MGHVAFWSNFLCYHYWFNGQGRAGKIRPRTPWLLKIDFSINFLEESVFLLVLELGDFHFTIVNPLKKSLWTLPKTSTIGPLLMPMTDLRITLIGGPGGLEGHVSKWKTLTFRRLHRRQKGGPAGCIKRRSGGMRKMAGRTAEKGSPLARLFR